MGPLRFLVALALLPAATVPASAQISRASLIKVVQLHKATVLRYFDAAPDSMLGFRPTPGVRTFAEQIEHASRSDAGIAHFAITGVTFPTGTHCTNRPTKALTQSAVP